MTEFNRAFVDTCVFIYYLERNPNCFETVKEFFSYSYENSNELVTSAVTIAEYSIIPYRNNDLNLIADFNRFLSDMAIHVADVDRAVADKAAQIRAVHSSFKHMDALQLAVAVQNN